MEMLSLDAWGKQHKITLITANYANNDNLYVGLECWDDGYPEPWSDATVNLGFKLPADTAFLDINNNGNMFMDWLIDNGLGMCTGRVEYSGWCVYPEFKFNMERVAEYCA